MPKVVDHDQRREVIVVAAQRCIAAFGLEGATMRKIAEAASCTTGLLSHYFSSRDEILMAALKAAHQAARQRVAAVAEADPANALRQVLVEALPLDDLRRNEWLVWMAFWSQAAYSPPMLEEHIVHYRHWRAFLAELLRHAASLQHFTLDADEEALRLSSLIDGLGLHLALTHGGSGDLAAIQTLDLHLEALGV